FDAKGERSGKAMTDCSGAEILYELVSVLNLEEAWDDIRETVVNVIPMHRKYDKSYLRPVESKLEIIPTGISNLAVSGEFTDGDGSVFTEEFAVTTAKKAAYRLCENKQKVYTAPPVSISGIKSLLKRKFK
ncbi:MAG: oleate hydratase, partial [Clostridia bacterium]|nr:oleate hydratase [Clostridia bacterium]